MTDTLAALAVGLLLACVLAGLVVDALSRRADRRRCEAGGPPCPSCAKEER